MDYIQDTILVLVIGLVCLKLKLWLHPMAFYECNTFVFILNTGATKAPRLGKFLFFHLSFYTQNKLDLKCLDLFIQGETGVIEGSGNSVGGGPGEGKS